MAITLYRGSHDTEYGIVGSYWTDSLRVANEYAADEEGDVVSVVVELDGLRLAEGVWNRDEPDDDPEIPDGYDGVTYEDESPYFTPHDTWLFAEELVAGFVVAPVLEGYDG